MKFELPALAVPRLGLVAFRRRIVFHTVFLLLVIATLALALSLLTDEKRRSYQRYTLGFNKSLAEISAQLRNPAGQLALLNPGREGSQQGALTPMLLPFSAIDFDDQYKAQRAVEMSGCAVQYADGATLCVAVGSNAYAGGFIYLVGSLDAGPLTAREHGGQDLSSVTRALITLQMRGQTQQWIAPFEAGSGETVGTEGQRGRLTGFAGSDTLLAAHTHPQRDFSGWLWREGPCISTSAVIETEACPRRTFYSIRLPVEAFREALFQKPKPAWPPADLDRIFVRLQLRAPSDAKPLFDSDLPSQTAPFSLAKLSSVLAPGETLAITKLGAKPEVIATQRGADDPSALPSPWLTRLIRHLAVDVPSTTVQAHDVIVTATGRYELRLTGDLHSLDRALSATAARLSWLVGAMLAAIAVAWAVIEIGLIRRVAVLTQRAAAVSYNMQDPQIDRRIGELDVSDLRGGDEMGILAGTLGDLLQRVKDGLRREQLRAEHERDMWHAVGHEIMSPLQSLMVLHGEPQDASHRYVQRMQQAVRVLYGTASPSEALQSATLDLGQLDLNEFLRHVAANAHFAGIVDVRYDPLTASLPVHADDYSLEDAVTHVLRNADRYRPAGTPITLSLRVQANGNALLGIHNQGPHIEPAQLDKIFEYGTSDQEPTTNGERRGQGLFVAKTYLAKMDGTIAARNVVDGVVFEMGLRRV